MTKQELLEWVQEKQELVANLNDNGWSIEAEDLLYELEKKIKELD